MTALAGLIGATFFLIASHLIPSAPGVRARLLATLGRRSFYVAYSLISIAALALVIISYRAVGPSDWLYVPVDGARALAVYGMPVPVFLLVARLTTPPRTAEPRGIYRVTTVPGSLAVLLWTVLHLLNIGEVRTVIVFGAMAIIAAIALAKNAVLARRNWHGSAAVPFAAILKRRDRFVWREIGWWRVGLAALIYAGLLHLHPFIIGVDPLAGL